MAHTTRNKARLLARIRRMSGQLAALEQALSSDAGCAAVLQQIAAVRGAFNGLIVEVVEDHILLHVANPDIASDAARAKGAGELISVLRTYLK